MTVDPAPPHTLGEPITDGVHTVNFFNGRLLSAEDLRREQDTARRLRDRLGQAVGAGVVAGLQVRVPPGADQAQPVLAVTAGVAINRSGTALRLPYDTLISLAGRRTEAAADRRRVFTACSGLGDGTPLILSGVYLLTIAPSGAPVGRAAVSGLGNEAAFCNIDACAEGVEFRLIPLDLDASLFSSAELPYLRNRVAHLMYGTDDGLRLRLERDPFGTAPQSPGLLAAMHAAGTVHDDETALACVHWTPDRGIRFVDMWSVRRRVAPRSASAAWPEVTGQERPSVGEAVFLQFQDEIRDLSTGTAPTAVTAASRFRRLPPAGLVPLASSGRPRGFDEIRFFDGLTTRPNPARDDPIFADGAWVESLLRSSIGYPPIDLSTGELIWLYLVRQNTQVSSRPPPQSYVLFASGFLSYVADARFDLARFDFANFALRLA